MGCQSKAEIKPKKTDPDNAGVEKGKIMSIRFLACLILFLSSLQASKQTLTIYTYNSFTSPWGPASKIKVAFEDRCNCNLKFISISSAIGALRKIQLEGKKTKADILLGLDKSSLHIAKKTNLFIEHKQDTSKLSLPVSWNDKVFLPYDYGYFSFIYNSNKTKKVPNSFKDILLMPKKFKIIIQDPRSSSPGLGLVLWIKKIYGKRANKYWQKLSPYILTVTKSWSEAYGLFLKGEANMVLSYTTSPAYHIAHENKVNFKAVLFKEGHYGQIEVASILKSSKNKKLARDFLKFILSDDFANIIPSTNWLYPTVKTKNGLPQEFKSLHIPVKMLLIEDRIIDKNIKIYLKEWLNSI